MRAAALRWCRRFAVVQVAVPRHKWPDLDLTTASRRILMHATSERTAKAGKIRTILEGLYPEPPIFLDHSDPFTLLIAVLLSAQCTDARVNLVTPGLFALADSAEKMAQLPVEAILQQIRSCGLAPAKSQRISQLSKMLVQNHGGQVPADLAALEQLPGVGHKTASVVMSQAFGIPAFPVDTHIHRLAQRWQLTSGRNVETTEADLKALYPESCWSLLHRQFILFGREHCPARSHQAEDCPICSWAGAATELPSLASESTAVVKNSPAHKKTPARKPRAKP